jgi:hypothetical protein
MTTISPLALNSPITRPPVWRWVVGPWNSGPERELIYANSRQVTFTNNAPATATFNLPGRTDEASSIIDGLTDLWVWADTHLVFRGRVTGTQDAISENVYTLSITATDYRGLLTRRLLAEGDSPSTDGKSSSWSMASYARIAWGLVALTQAKPGGNFGITQGVWQPDPDQVPSGYRVRTYDFGQEIGQAIDDLAGDATFDYNIRPGSNGTGLYMNLYYPARSFNSGKVLDLGGTVAGLTRATALSNWANVTRTSGSPDTTVGVNTYTADPSGRFEQQIGYPDVVLQTTIASRAVADHSSWLTRQTSLSFDMRTGVINTLQDLDVGDTCLVVAKIGRLNINENRTVSEVDFTIDDQGIASTRVGVIGPAST